MRDPQHLAFETSWDDTSIAVFRGTELLSLHTESQLHSDTGGVVPEVAARLHANVVFDVLDRVLSEAQITLDDLDFISATSEPGLIPSHLLGKTVAKTLAHTKDIPLFWINHIEAHIFANLLERDISDIEFPVVCLTVSGWHNELYLWKFLEELELLGQTRDDAAGEAFDKIAKSLGLGFPGGPIISRLALEHSFPPKWLFPRVMLENESLDFSFSGLKSAVKREIDTRRIDGEISIEDMREIAYEFQDAVTDILTDKLFRAASQLDIPRVLLAGGVSANDQLREKITARASEQEMTFIAPVKRLYGMDNAAMVGIRGYYQWRSITR